MKLGDINFCGRMALISIQNYGIRSWYITGRYAVGNYDWSGVPKNWVNYQGTI
jgi:hypothetical protein